MTNVAKIAAPITQASAISDVSIPAVFYANTPVVTSGMLSVFYGTDVANIKKNYSRNSSRFIEGKHYFLIQGDELKDFKNSVTESHQVDKRTPKLTLWTERGAARHAKMLETDQAWEVFEQLEDCYFSAKEEVAEQQKKPKQRKSSSDERTPLRQYVEKMIANKSGMKYPAIWKLVHDRFDVQHINQLSSSESLEAVEFLKSIEGEFLGKQEALPKLDTPQFNDTELMRFVNLFLWMQRARDLSYKIYPSLRDMESRLAGDFWDLSRDTTYVISMCYQALARETAHIKPGSVPGFRIEEMMRRLHS
ncbi:ORF6N domain-containing protein [Cedecea sp. NFIX57]|uniref:ORF6N domain-containing protein n=1 Tax=Cedecea sp. NFIX57 TaxID=1566286 RepID=UPI000A0CB845|nr:ORF6N domain-containing protein [Cedecea sp. NFIX57]SMG61746.1 P22AR C-terminal domain-containing protein [Cedecea sp. NFIX57]